jgi:Protein of unknown function (DUF3352)
MRTRVGALLLCVLAVLVLAACGGGGGGGGSKSAGSSGGGSVPDGADFVPSSAPGFVYLATDPNVSQWKAANDLLQKFPGRAQLLSMIEQRLAKQKLNYETDIKPALGPETDLGILKLQGQLGRILGVAKPNDEAKFLALLDKLDTSGSKLVHRKIDGWTVVSDTQTALDASAAAHNGSSLKDNTLFTDGIGALPGDALAKVWFNGAAVTNAAKSKTGSSGTLAGFGNLMWVAASAQAQADGLSLHAIAKSDKDVPLTNYSSDLVKQVPAGVLAYLSFKGLDGVLRSLADNPAVQKQLGSIEQSLGITLADLAPLFAGEGALYVRQGIPLPEITLALEVSDEAAARSTAEKLFTRLAPALGGEITTTTVAGVQVKQIRTSSISLYYGVFDGKLVVTDSTTGIAGLKDTGAKLADDSLFKDAKDAAGMPDSTAGFLYVNLKDTIPLVENLVTAQGGTISPTVQQNLEPLNTALFYGTVNGQQAELTGFVGVK